MGTPIESGAKGIIPGSSLPFDDLDLSSRTEVRALSLKDRHTGSHTVNWQDTESKE